MQNHPAKIQCETSKPCLPSRLTQLSNKPETISKAFLRYLTYHLGRFKNCPPHYLLEALALTLRDRLVANWHSTRLEYHKPGVKCAHYLSLEFLLGRALGNHVLNLNNAEQIREAMNEFCLKLEEIEQIEHDAGLGNGGLGRLAACFMDSCATLALPVTGYGIRYEYGMFHQHIKNGYQHEAPDHWLVDGYPWEIKRPEYKRTIRFGGHTEFHPDDKGQLKAHWVGTSDIYAIPFDTPISGYDNNVVNTLRLWQAAATHEFNLDEFNAGSYTEAVAAKDHAEQISMVLYPNDSSENGKDLRLKQQYFLASASLQDVVAQWETRKQSDFSHFAAENVFQMNDTHPTIAVVELMRILLDEKSHSWDQAWAIVTQTMAYTNHTLLPEALEKWPVRLFQKLLPRLLDIIYEINANFMRTVAMKWPGDTERQRRMSLIEEGHEPQIRMAHLAIVGSFSVNGVAALHSELLRTELFHDFYELWPHKFNNKTNGVTPRRWIAHANPKMTQLISNEIGKNWISDLSHISKLSPLAEKNNKKFHKHWCKVKQANKQRLATLVKQKCDVDFDCDALFDVQVKRIHEYKRQLLNVLHIIHLYNRIKQGDSANWSNRCVLIGGKAAPGYVMAKSIIKLINNIADVINNDPDVGNKLKVAFLPNYDVSSMEIIAPGTDLSEQISTAGKEASGTGNMKFMMNGAITIGTYDGANIEILEAVGLENFFLFGLKAEEVSLLKRNYHPLQILEQDPDLKAVIHLLRSGHFNAYEPGIFDDILNAMLSPYDPWVTLADFRSYIDAQEQVSKAWQDKKHWTKMSILNTATSGSFSSDRTILQYNEDIWHLKPIK